MAGIGRWRVRLDKFVARARGHRMTRDEALHFMDEARAKSGKSAPGEDSVSLIRRWRGPI
jgi:hypothetical protein